MYIKFAFVKLTFAVHILFMPFFIEAQTYRFVQKYNESQNFTAPQVYDICEDDNGFIWFATNTGVFKFDGTRFIKYTVHDGLPDNDVINLAKENDGTIWANTFKQAPSYFDERTNSFVCFDNNDTVKKYISSLLLPGPLKNGGMSFSDKDYNLIFKKQQLVAAAPFNGTALYYLSYNLSQRNKAYRLDIFDTTKKLLYQKTINTTANDTKLLTDFQKFIYLISANNLHIFFYNVDKQAVQEKLLTLPQKIKYVKSSNPILSIITIDNRVYFYNQQLHTLIDSLQAPFPINTAYIDKFKNLWLGSISNGLLYYKKTSGNSTNISTDVDQNFLSLLIDNQNHFWAGNTQSQVILYNGKKHIINTIEKIPRPQRILQILSLQNKILVISDNGYSWNYGALQPLSVGTAYPTIKAVSILDSLHLVLGTQEGICILNPIAQSTQTLLKLKRRINYIEVKNENCFYYIDTPGLVQYNLTTKKNQVVLSNQQFKNEVIKTACVVSNNSVFIATTKDNIYLFKNNQLQYSILKDVMDVEGISKIKFINDMLWVTSKNGLFAIYIKSLPQITYRAITRAYGLPSNIVNDFVVRNDSLFIATANGLHIMPITDIQKPAEVFPYVISVKINNQIYPKQSQYNLQAKQKLISLDISGVNSNGHFKQFVYRVNGKSWTPLKGNYLNLMLTGGKNLLEIKALNYHGQYSKQSVLLTFNVAIPVYEQLLFWILIFVLISISVVWYFYRRGVQKQRAELAFQTKLHKQRMDIFADLHDDVGSSLSSLQLNSAIAKKVLQKDAQAANHILEKIESQSKNISETISDFIWSMKPGKEEFMSLSMRIKNFTQEILGDSTINYQIFVDERVDSLITEPHLRKNIVMITKEAINNASKYSHASEISIQLNIDAAQTFQLQVHDNGIGFDPGIVKGNGVNNMKKRAKEINAQLLIVSGAKNGTTINLSFNIPKSNDELA